MVKINDYDKVNKDNIVQYRDNWLFEFNPGKSGEEGLMSVLRKAIYKQNGMQEI